MNKKDKFYNEGDIVILKSSPKQIEYYWVVIKMECNDDIVVCVKDVLNSSPIEYKFPYECLTSINN